MLQAGRHRASTHKGVDVTAFHACAFAASGSWVVIGTQRVLRCGPYPPHKIYFRAGTCVLLPSVCVCPSVIYFAKSKASSLAPPAFPLHGQRAGCIPTTYRMGLAALLVPRWPWQPARHTRSRFGLAKRTSNAQRIGFGRTRFKWKKQVVISPLILAAARRRTHIRPRKESVGCV